MDALSQHARAVLSAAPSVTVQNTYRTAPATAAGMNHSLLFISFIMDGSAIASIISSVQKNTSLNAVSCCT